MSEAEEYLKKHSYANSINAISGIKTPDIVNVAVALDAVSLARKEEQEKKRICEETITALNDLVNSSQDNIRICLKEKKEVEARVRLASINEFQLFLSEPDNSSVIPMNLGKRPVKIFMGEFSEFKKFKNRFLSESEKAGGKK